jgi:hypothetical protein
MAKAKEAALAAPSEAKVEQWPLTRFKPYKVNPRKHSEEAVAQFATALQRFGFRVPVLARSDGELIDGHFRLKAAEKAGLTQVPVMLADDMSPEAIRAFRLSVNRMSELADWDQDNLLRELEALQDGGEKLDENGPLGFELEEFDHKVKSEEWDFTPVRDLFVVTLTGSLPLEDEVRARLKGLEGVVIEASSVPRSA